MLGREVEGDAMVRLAQECLTGDLGSKHTGLAFDAEVALEAAVAGNEADDGLGEVNVEIVADDVPPGVAGSAAQQVVEKSRKIPFSAGFADHALDLAGGNIEGGDQGLSAVAAVLELTPRRMASSAISRWLQWLIGRSLSDGFSQVIATTAQICWGVKVAGAPDRGASASRSGTDCPLAASRHRLRQYRTVFGHTPSSR